MAASDHLYLKDNDMPHRKNTQINDTIIARPSAFDSVIWNIYPYPWHQKDDMIAQYDSSLNILYVHMSNYNDMTDTELQDMLKSKLHKYTDAPWITNNKYKDTIEHMTKKSKSLQYERGQKLAEEIKDIEF